MTPEEIITYHSNIALWEGLISTKFKSYCKDKGIGKHGLLDLLGEHFREDMEDILYGYDFYLSINNPNKAAGDSDDYYDDYDYYDDSRRRFIEDEIKSIYSDYCDFCEKRLTWHYFPESKQTAAPDHKDTEDWNDFFNKATINEKILSHAIKSYSPFRIIYNESTYDEYYIEPEELLSFCDKEKKLKLLFNALVSIIYNAIITESGLANQHEYSQLLYKSLVGKIEGDYHDPYDLYVILKDLGPDVCKSFLWGFGLNKDDAGALIAYLKTNEEGKVIDQIIKNREKGLLKADSKLIELCVEFKTAQKENKFIDWCNRFSLKGDVLQELNAGLMHLTSKNHLFAQDIITSLKDSIYPELSITAANVPKWAKDNLTAIQVPKKGRFISGSTEFVIKEKLIKTLLDNWIEIDEGREEVERKLYYFFNDGQVSELPHNLETYTIMWRKSPKPQLIYILIRLLYNDNWNIVPEDIVYIDEKTNRIVFDDSQIRELPKGKGSPIMSVVNEVFSTEAKGFIQKKVAENQKHLEPAQRLVRDILECKR